MPSKIPPNIRPEAEAARLARLAREADALRANLRRRKAQARAKADTAPAEPGDRESLDPQQTLES